MSQLLDVRAIRPMKNGTGYHVFRLTLPQEWIKKHGLQQGGKLLISEDEDRLILQKQ